MSELTDALIPAWEPTDWDVPRNVGIAAGILSLAGLGYLVYRFMQEDDEEEDEDE